MPGNIVRASPQLRVNLMIHRRARRKAPRACARRSTTLILCTFSLVMTTAVVRAERRFLGIYGRV